MLSSFGRSWWSLEMCATDHYSSSTRCTYCFKWDSQMWLVLNILKKTHKGKRPYTPQKVACPKGPREKQLSSM